MRGTNCSKKNVPSAACARKPVQVIGALKSDDKKKYRGIPLPSGIMRCGDDNKLLVRHQRTVTLDDSFDAGSAGRKITAILSYFIYDVRNMSTDVLRAEICRGSDLYQKWSSTDINDLICDTNLQFLSRSLRLEFCKLGFFSEMTRKRYHDLYD